MWKRAMKIEMEALKENDTWVMMKKPDKCEIIDSRWVFKIQVRKRSEMKKEMSQNIKLDW